MVYKNVHDSLPHTDRCCESVSDEGDGNLAN